MSYTNGNAHKYAVWQSGTFVHMFDSETNAIVFALNMERVTGREHEARRVSDYDQSVITAQANARHGLGAWL